MKKPGIKRPEIKLKNILKPAAKQQPKAVEPKIKDPVLTDNNRVVFSEEINRYSDMNDG